MRWAGGRWWWSEISLKHCDNYIDLLGWWKIEDIAMLEKVRVWKEYRVEAPNPACGGGVLTTERFPSARGISLDKWWIEKPWPGWKGLDGETVGREGWPSAPDRRKSKCKVRHLMQLPNLAGASCILYCIKIWHCTKVQQAGTEQTPLTIKALFITPEKLVVDNMYIIM